MSGKHHTKRVILLALFSALLFACETPLPIREMAEAKGALSEAKKYSADDFAKNEYDVSEKLLYDAQTFVKDGKTKEASEAAVKSRDKAKESLAKALPLYAQAAVNTAKTDIASVKSMYAAEFAPQELAKAEELLADAEKRYASNEYILSHDKAVESSGMSEKTRQKVLAFLPVLQGKIASLEAEYDELKSMNAEESAADKMKMMSENILKAKIAAGEKKTKEASDAVNAASALSSEIRDTILSANARKKISQVEDLAAKLSVAPTAADNKSDLDEAKDRIKTANDYFDLKDYTVAVFYAEDALSILGPLPAEKKIETSEQPKTPSGDGVSSVTQKIEQIKEAVREYVVQWRKINTDCLWRIAEKLYGNAKLWPLIYAANRSQIKDPDLIYPGQKFVIPPVPVKDESVPAEEKKADGSVSETPSASDAAAAAESPAPAESPAAAESQAPTAPAAVSK
jgi:nucleoid-associated protein YgaU